MASKKAHHTTGWAAGVAAAALVVEAGASGPFHVQAALALLAGVAGGTAPDWLELAWWSRRRKLWITHRTWTHWGLAWLALLAGSFHLLVEAVWAPAAFGFAAGGTMHLLADWPNPLGVPWICGRHSLGLWKSGRGDTVVVAGAWALAIWLADQALFEGVHLARALSLIRAV